MIDNEIVDNVDTSSLPPSDDTPGVPPTLQTATTPEVSSGQEMHFKTLRQLREKAERERDDALRQLEAFKNNQPKQESNKQTFLGADDLAEGKHLNKLYEDMNRLEQKVSNYEQSSSTLTAETRLRSQYPDIEKVVSKENMEVLAVQYPELYATIQANNDFYTKGVSAYTMLKKLGIHITDNYSPDREAASKNAAKPRPATSLSPQQGDSPLSQANGFASGLTADLKAQLYKEMIESMRNH